MAYITSAELEVLAEKVIIDYTSFRLGKITREKLKTSVGFQISSFRQYEIEDGQYSNRSICVIPTNSNIIDLVLYYNTDLGPAKYVLTIRPGEGNTTIVSKNKLYYLDSDYKDPHESKKALKTSKKYFSENESFSGTRNVRQNSKPPTIFPKEFFCVQKNRQCCYLNKKHSSTCTDCCRGEAHYM